MKKRVKFCAHAYLKFKILREHGMKISEKKVRETLRNADCISRGYGGRRVAQKALDARHVLRVIFEETDDSFEVITFYPARRQRYENEL